MPRNSVFVPVQFTIETSLNQYPVFGSMPCRHGREILLIDAHGPVAVVILVFLSEKDRMHMGTIVINNSLATPGESMFFSELHQGAQVITYGTVFVLRRTSGSIQSIIKCMNQSAISCVI